MCREEGRASGHIVDTLEACNVRLAMPLDGWKLSWIIPSTSPAGEKPRAKPMYAVWPSRLPRRWKMGSALSYWPALKRSPARRRSSSLLRRCCRRASTCARRGHSSIGASVHPSRAHQPSSTGPFKILEVTWRSAMMGASSYYNPHHHAVCCKKATHWMLASGGAQCNDWGMMPACIALPTQQAGYSNRDM